MQARNRYILILVIIALSCTPKRTILIDEKLSNENELHQLDDSEIFSYTTVPRGAAPPDYKKYNNEELVLIITNKFEKQRQFDRLERLTKYLNEAKSGGSILFMYNGVEVEKKSLHKLEKLKAVDLNAVEALDPKTSAAILTDTTHEKVILINTFDMRSKL